jgi:hypothetical protein
MSIANGLVLHPGSCYLKRLPAQRDIPAGQVVVHNSVRPTRRLGSRGFRAWLASRAASLEPCPCGWAPELGEHYRVAGNPKGMRGK